nr:MAG TPA: major tail protein [Caudoviricetes sp.]
MAETKYTGSGSVASTDYKYIKWVGKTKGGQAVTIEMPKAICKSNIDLKFAEKDDTVPEIEFEGVYDDDDLATGDRTEPWTITFADGVTAGNGEIVLGVGKFYVGAAAGSATCVGLTRGGGHFTVEREYREINADEDPGAVENRIEQVSGRPKLKLNALQWLTKIATLYSGVTAVS